MAEIVIAVGVDPEGKLTNLYTGPDLAAGEKACIDAGDGTYGMTYVFRNPEPVRRFHFDTPAQKAVKSKSTNQPRQSGKA